MSFNFLTVHSLTALPVHNANRDDAGQPKQLRQGGTSRGVLSSQSIKRAARIGFERTAADLAPNLGSIRSRSIPQAAVDRATTLASNAGIPFDAEEAYLRATKTVTQLVSNTAAKEVKAIEKANTDRARHLKKAPAGTDADSYMADYDAKVAEKAAAAGDSTTTDTVIYVSAEEVESLAVALVESTDDIATDSIFRRRTGSLALAGFGRMTANAPHLRVEAGIAVSPAVTTHAITVDIDYFTATDDRSSAGAAHLDHAFQTSGVYYRNHTYDRRQIRNNWTGWDSADVDELLRHFVLENVLALPQGRKNSSGAQPFPDVIIAEQQIARRGYSFDQAVQPAPGGGYLTPSVDELYRMSAAARSFYGDAFGDTVISGLAAVGQASKLPGAGVVTMTGVTDFITSWLRA
ncbi:type I-E CRISPR-associated protein Cas7/Cse4/CasC [Frigoribacterium sp. SL97]|uniref:type I-E CRISPR-associated protein Cas7/Cse4/CasC n=1 Tax=Frigoribacterium sp. SL97 TaxID=2994664 RepID=UPI0022701CBF|nr:type I-E CRISPR-associated protein Cas7/Cse4/CasC [Frigoribacterium sp. SL97]WAC50251.1 type I-E CRISPR-associated protein Cas7/Cse4/CasC [Frigoribacterium sp. SL97]